MTSSARMEQLVVSAKADPDARLRLTPGEAALYADELRTLELLGVLYQDDGTWRLESARRKAE